MVKNRKEDNLDRALVLFPYLSLHLNQKGVQLTWNANLTGLEYWTASSKAKVRAWNDNKDKKNSTLHRPDTPMAVTELPRKKKGWRSKKAKSIQLHLKNS